MRLILTLAESAVGVQTQRHLFRHAPEEPRAAAPPLAKAEESMLPRLTTKQLVAPADSVAFTATNLRTFAFCDWWKQVRTSRRTRVSSVGALSLGRSFLSLRARSLS